MRLSKHPIVLEEEKEDFPLSSILAETRGTMGLFLGLSILEVLSFLGASWLRLSQIIKVGYGQMQKPPVKISTVRKISTV